MEIETLAEIEIKEIDKIGPKGLSAYEVYVKNGGTLSETEWLKSLRGEQGPQGEPGAVKMQVVDTLPDTGESDTIYLLKKGIPSQQNLYDEYVYANGSWEHIGDTSVDLTDYYTRGDLLTCYVKSNIYLPGLSTGAKENINVNALTEIQNFINDNFGKIAKFAVVASLSNLPTLFEPFETDGTNTFPILKNKPTSIILAGYYKKRHFGSGVSSDSLMSATMSLMQMVLTLSWVENTCTITAGYIRRASGTDKFVGVNYIESYFLGKNNNTPYTPSGPYNPATKKYVDDNKYTLPVASAETLGGIKLGEGLSADENGVVSAQVGETIPYTYAEYGFFSGIERQITDTVFITNVENIITTYLNKSKTVKRIGAFSDTQSTNTNPVFMTYSCYNKITTSRTSFTFYGDTSFFMSYNDKYQIVGSVITVSGTWNDNQFHITTCNVKGVPNNTVIATSSTALLKNNTTSFTPTGDYNPSTKLYTDKTHYENMTGYDATKTQVLKNVNGTLTWVDEG